MGKSKQRSKSVFMLPFCYSAFLVEDKMNKNKLYGIIGATIVLVVGSAFVTMPAQAERQPEVKYEVVDLNNRAEIQLIDKTRVNKIVNDYLYKMKAVEKYDNDLRYLIIQSNKLSFAELSRFLDKNAMPVSQTLLSVAGEVTSQSSAIRELHNVYMDYITKRHQVLAALATLSSEKTPKSKTFSSSTFSSYGTSHSYTEYEQTEEHIPSHTYTTVAAFRQALAECDVLRNEYYNRKDYILRNRMEVIGEEK